ncbi:MAG: CpaF family protein [Lachnospiraceae bacterium]|nr:CpaF family protein [Lachnospiraceae bacterium]
MKRYLSSRVQERLGYVKDVTDEEVEAVIDEVLLQERELIVWPVALRRRLQKEIFDSLRRLDILQIFVEDADITEIMINGPEQIFVEKNGQIQSLDIHFDSSERLLGVIQQIVAGCNRTVNTANPVVDARLPDGSRVNVVMEPVALNGPIVTIRRFPKEPITMGRLVELQAISREAADFLRDLVRAGYNIMVSGGTGSGKTTFLNALSEFIPNDTRVITIEDSAELQLQGCNNLVRLETRVSNGEGCETIDIRQLIRTSLRMRPDRMIVGEVRGGEAFDLLQCLNTGHDGSMSTAHANSAADLLSRLENMVLMGMDLPLTAIKKQIAAGIDVIVHLSRMRDRSRKVTEIVEVEGFYEGEIRWHPLFLFREASSQSGQVTGQWVEEGQLWRTRKLLAAGLLPGAME